MKIQFHGHACFSIFTEAGTHLLIDPFLNGNSQAKITADDLTPDVILLTHGHWDHIGDTVSIAKRTGCLVDVYKRQVLPVCGWWYHAR